MTEVVLQSQRLGSTTHNGASGPLLTDDISEMGSRVRKITCASKLANFYLHFQRAFQGIQNHFKGISQRKGI